MITTDDLFHLIYAIGLIGLFASGFNSGYQR